MAQLINSIQFSYHKYTSTTIFRYMMLIKKGQKWRCMYLFQKISSTINTKDNLQESVTCELQIGS